MRDIPIFDVIVGELNAKTTLGRAWLFLKENEWRIAFSMDRMPLPSQDVHLANTDGFDLVGYPSSYDLKVGVKGGEGELCWQTVGSVARLASEDERAFKVDFNSIPVAGNLAAFVREG